jgi:hypothetical protein
MDRRRNVRAGLHASVSLQGTDRCGNQFDIIGESVDFSRKGLGLMLQQDVVAPGSIITVTLANHFNSKAIVQWTKKDPVANKCNIGVRLIDPTVSLKLRIAASVLLIIASLTQLSIARPRSYARSQSSGSCVMSLFQMKSVIEKTLSKYAIISENEKAFIHLQHQHMSCEEYTKLYEKSDFFANSKSREAIEKWHWNIYHAKEASVRESAVHSAEANLGRLQ